MSALCISDQLLGKAEFRSEALLPDERAGRHGEKRVYFARRSSLDSSIDLQCLLTVKASDPVINDLPAFHRSRLQEMPPGVMRLGRRRKSRVAPRSTSSEQNWPDWPLSSTAGQGCHP